MNRITKKRIFSVLGVVVAVGALALTITMMGIAPKIRLQGMLVSLKSTFLTLNDYQKAHGVYPAEFGAFGKCSFVSPDLRDAPELTGFYYLGVLGAPDHELPMVVRSVIPHWFYQGIFRLPQRTWVQYTNGHSEIVELPPEARGVIPLAEAIQQQKKYIPEVAEKIRSRFGELEAKR